MNQPIDVQMLEQMPDAAARRREQLERLKQMEMLLCEAQDKMDGAFLALDELPEGREYVECQKRMDDLERRGRRTTPVLAQRLRAFRNALSEGRRVERAMRHVARGIRGYRGPDRFHIPTWDELQPEIA